jgi:hypothetical protein
MQRSNKYPNGYAEKIAYWNYKMNKAIANLDADGIEFAAGKLKYFVGRQLALRSREIPQMKGTWDALDNLNIR